LNCSRSTRFRILPLGLRGISATKTAAFGSLKPASLPLHQSSSSASATLAPYFATTTASGTSPQVGDGRPITAASASAGCASSMFSISAG
jgi:hypothetical protein